MSGSWDIATATSLLTGVAKVQINGGNNLTKPTQAVNLVEVVPYTVSSGAYTAGESIALTAYLDSFSVDLLPKRIIVPPIQSGLGTIANTVIPLLESYECNTGLQEGATSQFIISGQSQVAPTVATTLGCALNYSTTPPNRPEHFYHKPDNESTFTTATTTTGNDFTINDGMWLGDMYVSVFDLKANTRLSSGLGICRTFFVCFILATGALLFSRDSNELVIAPIEAMIMKVNKIAKNPLNLRTLTSHKSKPVVHSRDYFIHEVI